MALHVVVLFALILSVTLQCLWVCSVALVVLCFYCNTLPPILLLIALPLHLLLGPHGFPRSRFVQVRPSKLYVLGANFLGLGVPSTIRTTSKSINLDGQELADASSCSETSDCHYGCFPFLTCDFLLCDHLYFRTVTFTECVSDARLSKTSGGPSVALPWEVDTDTWSASGLIKSTPLTGPLNHEATKSSAHRYSRLD